MIISIEGNIGSGKTTLTKLLKDKTDKYIIVGEPIEEWLRIRDENDKNILDKFYNNQKEYSFQFQIMAYITKLKLLNGDATGF